MLKTVKYILSPVCVSAALLFASCSVEDEVVNTPQQQEEGAVVYPKLRIGVSELKMEAASRAASPMSPDHEKYVRTMALFEFDNEQWHEKGDFTYHFIDFVAGTVDGVAGVGNVQNTDFGIVETTLDGIAFEARTNGTLCVVANVTEDEVDDFYTDCMNDGGTYGNISLNQFKTWALPFDYEESTAEGYDESVTGHLKNMYMFGYYEGPIDPAGVGDISIDLGRLASRLDITVVNETGSAITKRLGYHFDNVCSSAYFFPLLSGVPPTIQAGLARTVICAGEGDPVEGDPDFQIVPATFPDKATHTRYYYVAAHSAENFNEATKLHLFYDRRIVNDDVSDDTNSVKVPLCNVHPSEAANIVNGYSLSRNTRYHFTIRLKKKAASPAKAAESRSEVEYGEQPGEITVYLP